MTPSPGETQRIWPRQTGGAHAPRRVSGKMQAMASASCFPSTLPELGDATVTLRALEEADIPAWFVRATDVEAADLAGDPVPASIDLGLPWLQRQRDGFSNRTALRWAIVPAGMAGSVGTIGLSLAAPGAVTAELGIVISRANWRQGLGTAAVRLALRCAFGMLRLEAVHAEVLQRNPASIRLLEKTGFGFVKLLPPTADEPEVMLRYALANPGSPPA